MHVWWLANCLLSPFMGYNVHQILPCARCLVPYGSVALHAQSWSTGTRLQLSQQQLLVRQRHISTRTSTTHSVPPVLISYGMAGAANSGSAGPTPAPSSRAWHRIKQAVIPTTGRVDVLVKQLFEAEYPSSTAVKKAIRRGEITVDGVAVLQTDVVVLSGSCIAIQLRRGGSLNPPMDPPAGAPPVPVVYEDDHIACVIKMPGVPTMVDPVNRWSLQQALPHALKRTSALGAIAKPRPVHRLDLPTGGLVLCAKTKAAMALLSRAFATRQVTKRYQSMILGCPPTQGQVAAELGGAPAVTTYRLLHSRTLPDGQTVSTVDLWPHTGRTHQLRKHMALIGYPLLGDTRYTAGLAAMRPERVIQHTTGELVSLPTPATAPDLAVDAAIPANCPVEKSPFMLWAVELFVRHPVDERHLRFTISGVPGLSGPAAMADQ